MATTDFVVKNGLVVNQNLDVKGTTQFTSTVTAVGDFSVQGNTTIGNATGDSFTVNSDTLTVSAATFTIANTATTSQTLRIFNAATASGQTKTLDFGTGGVTGSTTNINIGSTNGGTTTVNSPSLSVGGAFSATASGGTFTVNPTAANVTINTTTSGTISITGSSTLTLGTAGQTTTMAGNISATTSNQTVTFSPTGTGTVTISPASTLTMNPGGAISITGSSTLTLGTAGQTTTMNGNISATTSNQTVTFSPTGTGTVTIQPAGGLTINPTTAGNINNTNIGASTRGTGAFTTLTANNAVTFTQNTGSTSTGTGTLVVTGGVGISERLYAGSIQNTPIGSVTTSTGAFTSLAASGAVTFTQNTASTSTGTGTLVVTGGVGVSGSIYANVGDFAGINISNTTIARPNGILKLIGGGGQDSRNSLTLSNSQGAVLYGGSATLNGPASGGYGIVLAGGDGNVSVPNTTTSTSTATGALVVSGGVGINENIYYGGSLVNSAAALGTTLGNTVTYASFRGTNSNANYLDIFMLREAAGTDWTTASTRIQQRIDSTFMAYMEFNGPTANGGIEWGSGTTTVSPQSIAVRMRLDSAGSLRLLTNTGSTSTTSGTLIVTGGVGISENVYIGGTLNAANLAYTGTTTASVSTISSAGTTQTDATQITTDLVIVNVVVLGQGIRLPTSSTGKRIVIRNDTATSVNVYPNTGASINGAAANTAYVLGATTTLEFVGFNTTQWYTPNATFA